MILEIKGIIARIISFNWEEKMVSDASVEKVALTRGKNGSFRVTRMKGGVACGTDASGWENVGVGGSVEVHAFHCLSCSYI